MYKTSLNRVTVKVVLPTVGLCHGNGFASCLGTYLGSFGVRSTSMLPQGQVRSPGHSSKSAGGRLHLNMPSPLTQ